MGKFIKDIFTKDGNPAIGTSLSENFLTLANGVKRTDTTDTKSPVSLVGIVDGNGVRNEPGFTPNDTFNVVMGSQKPTYGIYEPYGWYGTLLDSHTDSKYYNANFSRAVSTAIITGKKKFLSTEEKFSESKVRTDFYSTRDTYLAFNDTTQDYFKHRLAIDGLTPIKTAKNARESWDGHLGNRYRLQTYKGTPYENEDPVIYGYDIIIDAVSSPLLNGSIEDFIASYPNVSEIQSRRIVIYDFKKQFEKIFKTKGRIFFDPNAPASPMQSAAFDEYAASDTQKNSYTTGKKAYLAHYLQKIGGLELLTERNETDKHSPFPKYPADRLTLSFYEDVSGTLSALTHLYKLLYWSVPNGKNIIPENLLRFNCDIVVSEVRNFNRVRKVIQNADNGGNYTQEIEILKDNVSRHIYSLRECQLFFPKRPHDDTINLSAIEAYGGGQGPGLDVQMNFKYAAPKFEKWIPDPQNFGQYVGYNAGAIWKIGNKGARTPFTTSGNSSNIVDNSVPKFYTQGTNTLKHNGVTSVIKLKKYSVDPNSPFDSTTTDDKIAEGLKKDSVGIGDNPTGFTPINNTTNKTSDEISEDQTVLGPKSTKQNESSILDSIKDAAAQVGVNAVKSAKNFVIGEVNNQILIRAQLLEDTINKIKGSLGLNVYNTTGKSVENIYPKPYTPHSFGPWFDVRNELFNFLTEDTANIIGSAQNLPDPSAYPDINKINQFKQPNYGQKLSDIYNKNTAYNNFLPNEKGNNMYVKFGTTQETNKFYGKTLNDIVSNKAMPMDNKFAFNTPDFDGKNGTIKGAPDYSKIGFGIGGNGDHQKYPSPITNSLSSTLGIGTTLLKTNTQWFLNYRSIYMPKRSTEFNGKTLGDIIKLKSNPSQPSGTGKNLTWRPIDQKDFSKIGFGISGKGGDHQKFPEPISTNTSQKLNDIVKSNTIWSYPNNQEKFGKN